MDWQFVAVVGLYVSAVGSAVYRTRESELDSRKRLGTAIFLVGAAVGLFLDDLITTLGVESSLLLSLVEPIGAVIMGVGVLFWFWWTSE